MAEKAKPEKVTLLLDPPFFEVLKAAVYKRPGRGKISALIREKLANDSELRAIADEMGIDLDSFVVKPLGGYRGDKAVVPSDEPTKGKVERTSGIGQDRPATTKQAVVHSYPKSAQTGKPSNGRRNVDVNDES